MLLSCVSIHAVESEAILNERLKSAELTSVEGVDGWRFLPAEIKHLLAGDPSKDSKRPLETIVDFNQQLKQLGVRLIVVPVPAKVTIHPEFFDERLEGAGTSPPEAAFYEGLRAKGVEVVDLTQEFAGAKSKVRSTVRAILTGTAEQSLSPHKSSPKCSKASSETKLALDAREERIEIQGDLGGEKETVTLRFVQSHRARPVVSRRTVRARSSSSGTATSSFFMTVATCTRPARACLINSPLNLVRPSTCLVSAVQARRPARVSLARRARANPNYLAEQKSDHLVLWSA